MVKFGWDKLKRFLAQTNTWSGTQTFANAVIQAGSVAASVVVDLVSELLTPPTIGKTTPGEVWASPSASKGPAIITTFAGTVSTSGESTTITFTSAADAILAGYNATNPVLGTTLITTDVNQASVTRYIVSWTNATACVVDSVCTLAASSTLASVQLPIATFVNSAGVTQGWMLASGVVYFVKEVGIGTTGPGAKLHTYGSAADVANTIQNAQLNGNSSIWLYINEGGGGYDYGITNDGGKLKFRDNAGNARVTIQQDGNVGIGTTGPATKLDVAGAMQVSSAVALSLGGYVRTFAEATGTPSGTTTYFDIAVAVPTGCKLLGCQLRVDTALTAGETWGAAYVTGSTTTIAAAGRAVAQNTKVDKMHVDEITSNTTNIRITRDAGNFTDAAGVIRAIVYYETFTAMGTAA